LQRDHGVEIERRIEIRPVDHHALGAERARPAESLDRRPRPGEQSGDLENPRRLHDAGIVARDLIDQRARQERTGGRIRVRRVCERAERTEARERRDAGAAAACLERHHPAHEIAADLFHPPEQIGIVADHAEPRRHGIRLGIGNGIRRRVLICHCALLAPNGQYLRARIGAALHDPDADHPRELALRDAVGAGA
jgi:hypothetical protein